MTVYISDNTGQQTDCVLAITSPTASSTTPNPAQLACSLVATPSSPLVTQTVHFVAGASGKSTSPYTFFEVFPGSDGHIVNQLTVVTGNQSTTANATYPTSGFKTATATLTDSAGTQVACNSTINITRPQRFGF